MLYIVAWMLAFGAIVNLIARSRGCASLAWFAYGAVAFPIALTHILITKPTARTGITRACPHCAEVIKTEARVCKHCGRDVEPVLPSPPPAGAVACRSCRHPNEPQFKFCEACGAPRH